MCLASWEPTGKEEENRSKRWSQDLGNVVKWNHGPLRNGWLSRWKQQGYYEHVIEKAQNAQNPLLETSQRVGLGVWGREEKILHAVSTQEQQKAWLNKDAPARLRLQWRSHLTLYWSCFSFCLKWHLDNRMKLYNFIYQQFCWCQNEIRHIILRHILEDVFHLLTLCLLGSSLWLRSEVRN